jgi:hypothetical protein
LASDPRDCRSDRPAGVVACRRPCLCVALLASVDDIASIAILGLPTRVKDPLPSLRSTLVGRLPGHPACVNGRFWALSTAVVPHAALLAYAGCRAFGLLHNRLLDERLLSYGPPRAHYLGGYRDRLLGGPLGLPDLRCMVPDGVKHKDYRGEVLG